MFRCDGGLAGDDVCEPIGETTFGGIKGGVRTVYLKLVISSVSRELLSSFLRLCPLPLISAETAVDCWPT